MNKKLTEQIVYHVLSNLGVIASSFVNKETTKPIIDKQFLLSEKLSFEDEEGETIRKNVYGCQLSVADSKELKMILGDCTQDKNFPEYCLVVQLKDAPAFGLYVVVSPTTSERVDSEVLIAVSTDNNYWMPCSTYLQATFLAGMEQIRDIGFGWTKITNHDSLYKQLLSFIKFHHNFYGDTDEGQEE